MARGKHLSLEEARKAGKLKQFAKEHPAVAHRGRFERLLDAMARGKKPKAGRTSGKGTSED